MALVVYYFPHLVSVPFLRLQNTKDSLIFTFKYSKTMMLYTVWSVTNVTPQLSERNFVALLFCLHFHKLERKMPVLQEGRPFFLTLHWTQIIQITTRYYIVNKFEMKHVEIR